MNVEKEVSGTMKRLSRKFGFSISTLLPVLLLSAHSPVTEAEEADAEPDDLQMQTVC